MALTGSDTSSNALFGSLQTITAEQLGLSPVLMAAANSHGRRDGQDDRRPEHRRRRRRHALVRPGGRILRYVFFHSLALACLVGLLVMLQAYVAPFSGLVPELVNP